MPAFDSNNITSPFELIGEQLRQAREACELPLADVAEELQIKYDYLDALERGRPELLPTGVYGKNFLREYALYLNLDAPELVKAFAEENASQQAERQENLFSRKRPGAQYFLAMPKLLKNILIVSVILVCFAYLGYCVVKIVAPPELEVYFPVDNMTTAANSLTIRGLTTPEAQVLVNGEAVLTDKAGNFSEEIDLKDGLNTITVSARKKYSQSETITRKVMVDEPTAATGTAPNTATSSPHS